MNSYATRQPTEPSVAPEEEHGSAEPTEALRAFDLEGVVEDMRCPLLVLHGEHDEQVGSHRREDALDAGRENGPRGQDVPS